MPPARTPLAHRPPNDLRPRPASGSPSPFPTDKPQLEHTHISPTRRLPRARPAAAPLPYTPSKQRTAAPRVRTLDQIADEGLVGAIVIGNARSPEYAAHRDAEREKLFKDVSPVSAAAGGPFGFYNTAAAPRRRARLSASFKVPVRVGSAEGTGTASASGSGSRNGNETPARGASSASKPQSPRTPETPTSPTTARSRTRRVPEIPTAVERRAGVLRLRLALDAAFGAGPLADRVLAFWGRADADRSRLIDAVTREVDRDLADMAAQGEAYGAVLDETCLALKLVRDARGVELVVSGRIKDMTDPRVLRFKHVAVCFRTIKI